MKDGQRISFLLDEVIENKSFTTHSQMGQIKISLIHELSDHSITHWIEISGAPNAQLGALGQAIGSNLEQALNSLAPLAKQ